MDFSALTAGGPIPAVSPEDLRAVWELMRETQRQFLENREPELAGQQNTIGIDVSVLAQVCSPEANVLAVWARSTLLGVLEQQGLLSSWQRGIKLEDAVFDVAATCPLDRADPDALLQQLSNRRG